MIQVLSRRTKNNPVLIGEPGVGKTAIAEGLALRIVQGDVPREPEEQARHRARHGRADRRHEVPRRVRRAAQGRAPRSRIDAGNVILFIDELHTVVGAGAAEGGSDAANLLKPALARGELRCIGATTLDEYRKYIEKDAALERRFQPVFVGEPSGRRHDRHPPRPQAALRGPSQGREDQGLGPGGRGQAVAPLHHRPLPARQGHRPDGRGRQPAGDGAAKACPAEIDEVQRRLMQLELAARQLAEETEEHAKERLRRDRGRDGRAEAASWPACASSGKPRRSAWATSHEVQQQTGRSRARVRPADRDDQREAGRRHVVDEADYQKLYELDIEQQEARQAARRSRGQASRQRRRSDAAAKQRAACCARKSAPTKSPKSSAPGPASPSRRMLETERAKLLVLEERLHQRVVGQDEAVDGRGQRRPPQPQRPARPEPADRLVHLLGPTGVGKTELCKALAEVLFDDENAMVRIDMSEFMEKHTVSRLIGAPPGYVGYEEGGRLTEAVRRRPYSVVLLDEIEKAHRDVFNILLQVLDDGRLTDSHGHTVDFTNTIIVMTSNIGSQMIQEIAKEGGSEEEMREAVRETLATRFLPEFLNRIDETIIFHPLERNQIRKIVDMQIAHLRKQLEQTGLSLEVSERALNQIAVRGLRSSLRSAAAEARDPAARSESTVARVAKGTVSGGERGSH